MTRCGQHHCRCHNVAAMVVAAEVKHMQRVPEPLLGKVHHLQTKLWLERLCAGLVLLPEHPLSALLHLFAKLAPLGLVSTFCLPTSILWTNFQILTSRQTSFALHPLPLGGQLGRLFPHLPALNVLGSHPVLRSVERASNPVAEV